MQNQPTAASDAPPPPADAVKSPEGGGRRSRQQEPGGSPARRHELIPVLLFLNIDTVSAANLALSTDNTNEVEILIEEAKSTDKRQNQRAVELMWSLSSAGACKCPHTAAIVVTPWLDAAALRTHVADPPTLSTFGSFLARGVHRSRVCYAAETTELLVSKGAVETCIEMVNAGTNPYISQCALTTMANLLNADGVLQHECAQPPAVV